MRDNSSLNDRNRSSKDDPMSPASEHSPTPRQVQVLRLPQVIQLTGLCRSTIYQLEAEQRFPPRIKISTRAVGWLQGEVQAWLTKRVECSRGTTPT